MSSLPCAKEFGGEAAMHQTIWRAERVAAEVVEAEDRRAVFFLFLSGWSSSCIWTFNNDGLPAATRRAEPNFSSDLSDRGEGPWAGGERQSGKITSLGLSEAKCTSLISKQASFFLRRKRTIPKTLYIIDGGGNRRTERGKTQVKASRESEGGVVI